VSDPITLEELLERYVFHAGSQQDNLDTLIQSDEMARRLLKLREYVATINDGCYMPKVRRRLAEILEGREP